LPSMARYYRRSPRNHQSAKPAIQRYSPIYIEATTAASDLDEDISISVKPPQGRQQLKISVSTRRSFYHLQAGPAVPHAIPVDRGERVGR